MKKYILYTFVLFLIALFWILGISSYRAFGKQKPFLHYTDMRK